jgi:hypothetical protein
MGSGQKVKAEKSVRKNRSANKTQFTVLSNATIVIQAMGGQPQQQATAN